jgi:hypothetical protein
MSMDERPANRPPEERAASPARLGEPGQLAGILETLLQRGPMTTQDLLKALRERRWGHSLHTPTASAPFPEPRLGPEFDNVRREFELLGWTMKEEPLWVLTEQGRALAQGEPTIHPVSFTRALCLAHEARNKRVVSRLLARLWELHPERQGAVPLPPPPLEGLPYGQPFPREWLMQTWNDWLRSLATTMSGFFLPESLEGESAQFEKLLGPMWSQWGKGQQRKRVEAVMTDRLLHLLFGMIVTPRDVRVWQKRLDWAGLTLQARMIVGVTGHVWFPVGAFRSRSEADFISLPELEHNGLVYHIHTPSGQDAEQRFAELLYDCFRARQQRDRLEYVSLHAVRDHVCYLFRIGNDQFEVLLQRIFPRVLRGELPFSIALEVDVSPAERRRLRGSLPVVIDHIPRYIITMRRRSSSSQEREV